MPLKILLTNSSSIYGGGEFYVFELAQSLVGRGHSVWVSCRSDNLLLEKCKAAGIPVLPLDFPPKGQFPRFISALSDFLRTNGIQIIHSNTNYDRTAAAFASRFAGAAHVTNVHSFQSIQHNLTHWVRNHWMTDHVLVDGFCVKELLEREDRISPGKISVVYLGVQPDTMKHDEAFRGMVRREFGISDRETVIGNVARLVPFKGHSMLLRAFAEIVPKFPNARLMLVGDGELMGELRKQCESLGMMPQTIFAGFRDDLHAVYSAFDVYAHSSIEGGGETFPFAVLQALAQSLPVVVTRVGDVHAMVEEGKNGYVLPDGDPKSLAEKIAVLLSNPGRRSEMGKASLEILHRQFTLQRMTDAVEKVYRNVLQDREYR